MYILGLDPGTVNFAYSVIDYDELGGTYEVAKCGLIGSPLPKVENEIQEGLTKFMGSMLSVFPSNTPQIYMERYVNRGSKVSALETVNMMIGAMYKCNPYLFSSAVWKNHINKRLKPTQHNLKDMYPRCSVTPHELDATLIGLYGIIRCEKAKVLQSTAEFNECMRQVERASKSKKRNTRNQELVVA